MSRRHDRALGEHDEGEAPGAAIMHELQEDGEEDDDEGRTQEGEVDIDEDDIDHGMEIHTRERIAANAPAAATAAATSSAAPTSLQTLPSYKALMSSLSGQPVRAADSDERKGDLRDSAPSSLSPGAAAAAVSSSSAASYTHDADENRGYLRDDPDGADGDGGEDGDGEDAEAVDDGEAAFEPARRYTFEEMFARATRLERKGFLRKAAHYYLYCLEQFRYSHQHQDLIATCLRRLGDICYKNKKCENTAHATPRAKTFGSLNTAALDSPFVPCFFLCCRFLVQTKKRCNFVQRNAWCTNPICCAS